MTNINFVNCLFNSEADDVEFLSANKLEFSNVNISGLNVNNCTF